MPQALLEYRLERCIALAQRLVEFKDRLGTADFEAAMNDVHVSFLRLQSSFQITPPPVPTREAVGSTDGIRRVRVHGITLMVHHEVVIDVAGEHGELAATLVNRPLEDAVRQAGMLWDYADRPCDACGVYFANPGFETPTVRVQMADFALALHERCCSAVHGEHAPS
jgi:hypothetical protein